MKQIIDFEVVSNRSLNAKHFILTLRALLPLPPIFPGQFVEVRVDGRADVFLRRPLSVHDVDYNGNHLHLFIKKVGAGTYRLGELTSGEKLNIIVPLGRGFTLLDQGRVLLVGGGCGIAPMLYLSRKLAEKGVRPRILLGGSTQTNIAEVSEYQAFGETALTTEDGSAGVKGFVTDHPWMHQQDPGYRLLYACGPEPMMKAVHEFGKKHTIDCEVSLEHTMACGIGACLTCVVDTHSGHQLSCKDGPVFNTKELKW
ncbi:MAG: dihydroorotate dehydrogenase electron transfer subunit [Bacteroidales bacterium]